MRTLTLALLLGCVAAGPNAAATTIELESPEPGTLLSTGFVLERAAAARIVAVAALNPERRNWVERLAGLGEDRDDTFYVHAVLIAADTRMTVWRLSPDDARRERGNLMRVEADVQLPAGRYEIHLTALDRDAGRRVSFGGRAVERVDLRDSRIEIEIEIDSGDVRRFDPDGRRPDALLALGPVPSRRLERAGFVLTRETALRVAAVIEFDDDAPADYGWIADADTGQTVWLPGAHGLRPAGGATKNRRVDETVDLPAGRYVLAYGTDDSHAVDGFNAAPPDDPLGWGIALLPGAGFDRTAFSTFDVGAPAEASLGWSRVGDDATLRQPFRLKRAGAVRIEASGEFVPAAGFVDDARIVDAGSRRTVWRLTESNTVAAGGSAKNRRFGGTVQLSAGVYELLYVSDGSHAYGSWNGAVPFDPEAWGVRVWPGPDLTGADIEPLDPADAATPGRRQEATGGSGARAR